MAYYYLDCELVDYQHQMTEQGMLCKGQHEQLLRLNQSRNPADRLNDSDDISSLTGVIL